MPSRFVRGMSVLAFELIITIRLHISPLCFIFNSNHSFSFWTLSFQFPTLATSFAPEHFFQAMLFVIGGRVYVSVIVLLLSTILFFTAHAPQQPRPPPEDDCRLHPLGWTWHFGCDFRVGKSDRPFCVCLNGEYYESSLKWDKHSWILNPHPYWYFIPCDAIEFNRLGCSGRRGRDAGLASIIWVESTFAALDCTYVKRPYTCTWLVAIEKLENLLNLFASVALTGIKITDFVPICATASRGDTYRRAMQARIVGLSDSRTVLEPGVML
jgi:hypothetical protein